MIQESISMITSLLSHLTSIYATEEKASIFAVDTDCENDYFSSASA